MSGVIDEEMQQGEFGALSDTTAISPSGRQRYPDHTAAVELKTMRPAVHLDPETHKWMRGGKTTQAKSRVLVAVVCLTFLATGHFKVK